MAYLGDMSTIGKEGVMMGFFNLALFAGWGTGPLMGGLLSDIFRMETAFHTMAIFSLAAFLLVFFCLSDMKNKPLARLPQEERHSLVQILSNKTFRGIAILRLSTALGSGILFSFLPILAADSLGLSKSQIGFLLSCQVLLSALLQTPFGRLADKTNRTVLILLGSGIAAVGLFLVPSRSSFSELLLLSIVLATALGIFIPAVSAIAVELGRDYGMGRVMGAFNASISLGLISGSITSGFIMEFLGINFTFYYGAIMGVVGIGLFMWLHAPRVDLSA
jgi:MFS family permease